MTGAPAPAVRPASDVHELVAATPPQAALTRESGRWVLTMRRVLPHPVERVWPMLVEPARLARWSPVVPDRALDSVGPATTRQSPDEAAVDADVLLSDRPRELVHRWGDHVLRWTLEPADGGTRLTLEHTFDTRGDRGSFGAGWHLCLAVLTGVLAGRDVERVVGARAFDHGFAALRDRYEAAMP